MMDGKLSLAVNSWFQPFTKVVSEQSSPLSRLEPVKKSTSMRDTDALDVEYLKWLPILREVRDNIMNYEGLIYIPRLQ